MTSYTDAARVDEVIRRVQDNKKYQGICRSLVEQITLAELKKCRKQTEAVKHTRSKLHQIAGAYIRKPPKYDEWLNDIREALLNSDKTAVIGICRRIMTYHASTYERLPFVENFYEELFKLLPEIKSIVDLACGFNPLALPWMKVGSGIQYTGIDIYHDLAEFISEFLKLMKINGVGQVSNLLEPRGLFDHEYDLAFLFKVLPCLDQVSKGYSHILLETVPARFVAVSYPVKSLGGRNRA